MKFYIHKESRQGGRRNNQDRVGYAYSSGSLLLVICDGMGGHLNGEIASQYVIEYLAKAFRAKAQPRVSNPRLFIERALQGAHNGLLEYARTAELSETPRTTCVACIVQDGALWAGNIGDSRIYLVRNESVILQSNDHSYVQMLVEKGRITPDEALTHPEKHKIYSCVGQDLDPKVEFLGPHTLSKGDVIVLATDGLWGPLSPPLLSAAFATMAVVDAVPFLMDVAESVTGKASDNLSAVAMRWDGADGDATELQKDIENTKIIGDSDIYVAVEAVRLAIR